MEFSLDSVQYLDEEGVAAMLVGAERAQVIEAISSLGGGGFD